MDFFVWNAVMFVNLFNQNEESYSKKWLGRQKGWRLSEILLKLAD